MLLDWKERPFVYLEKMENYVACDRETAIKFGKVVKAIEISNRDYLHRYNKFCKCNKMKQPPSSNMHIYIGYLVVRNLNTPNQYETWMPSCVFDELYKSA